MVGRNLQEKANGNGKNAGGILQILLKDGMLTKRDIESVFSNRANGEKVLLHPLLAISEKRINRATPPYDPLTLEVLLTWLAGRTGLPYQRIDPLKVDVGDRKSVV